MVNGKQPDIVHQSLVIADYANRRSLIALSLLLAIMEQNHGSLTILDEIGEMHAVRGRPTLTSRRQIRRWICNTPLTCTSPFLPQKVHRR